MNGTLLPAIAIMAVTGTLASGPYNIRTECPSIDPVGGVVHLPHQSDCTKFYKCSNGKKFIQDCPLYDKNYRLYYDPELEVCNWPWDVTCWTERKECDDNQSLQPYPYDCSFYYECVNGERALKSCREGDIFDTRLMACMPKAEANCNTYLDTCPPDGFLGAVYLPHECKCGLYYKCVNGELIERLCPSGQGFDVVRRECVAAKDATCNTGSNQLPVTVSCPASGIKNIPHGSDCSLYYECIDGVQSEKKCDHGLSFDETKCMCTWPPSSDCSLKGDGPLIAPAGFAEIEVLPAFECPANGSKDVYSPHHCSCTKYYACMGGEKVLRNCPNDMEFDYIRRVCDRPGNAVCKHRKSKSALASLTSSTRARQCSARGNERLPHEFNCRLYYQCRRGKKHLQTCYEGHYFNEIIESCDLPVNTNCVDGTETTESTTTPKVPDECPATGCEGIVRLPNPGNCALYYKCENGRKVEKECPKDLHFDPAEEICDWPENVKCVPKKVCVTGDKANHECQCNLYYECRDGLQILRTCPEGKNFDYKRKVCDAKDNVICFPGKEVTNECIGSCKTGDSTEILPHEDCTKYCECSKGVSHVTECPKNKYYDPAKQKCDWPENVANLKCDPFPCSSTSTGQNLPHECYCDRYYVCRNGAKKRENCGKGLHFDYETQSCIMAEKAHCFANEPIPETEDQKQCSGTCSPNDSASVFPHKDCKKYCRCTDGRRNVYKCPNDLFYDPEKEKCDWPENIQKLGCDPFPCTEGSSRITALPHECNCSLYYICSDGTKSRESCDDGFSFDYVEQACVESGKAHCYKKPSDLSYGDCS